MWKSEFYNEVTITHELGNCLGPRKGGNEEMGLQALKELGNEMSCRPSSGQRQLWPPTTNIPGAHKTLGTWEGEQDLPWYIFGFKRWPFQLALLSA